MLAPRLHTFGQAFGERRGILLLGWVPNDEQPPYCNDGVVWRGCALRTESQFLTIRPSPRRSALQPRVLLAWVPRVRNTVAAPGSPLTRS